MKTISLLIPTYNEEDNVRIAFDRISKVMNGLSDRYTFELIFIDNYSTDKTRLLINDLCHENKYVKAIFNARNFGFIRSIFYGLTQAEGDGVILINCDMQDPPEVITKFIEEWESGYKVVVGVKNKSKENPIKFFFRKIYYKFIKMASDVEHISQFTGFGLYDASFIKILRELKDPLPFLKGIIAELGPMFKEVEYLQDKRQHGKTKFNFFRLYDLAMLGITSYTTIVLRMATLIGFLMSIVCFCIAIYTFVLRLVIGNEFQMGMAAVIVGVFFLGSIQLFFIGLLGEYILSINTRVMNRPLVVEEKRINFNEEEEI
ncbi:MAG: glycosyltransferase family 2 protein [Defluviitaleaceae bacterium]|nr:glycosyltransferase family 2 protein [Defluviitaleaceae bacterium]